MLRLVGSMAVLLLGTAALAQSDEQRSTLADQTQVAVTIYNDNLALVKDQRRVTLRPGPVALAFRDVSARMRPETALLRSLSAPGSFRVLEQNFDFDLLTPQKLLEKAVGRSVQLVRTHPTTGAETTEQAQVLAAASGIVLQVGSRIETGLPNARIVYHDVPPNLRDRPTLVMALDHHGTAAQELELSYLTAGLGWRADYVVELNAADDRLDLSGWVTLTNTSGTTYRNARLQLVAGDVNQVSPAVPALRARAMMAPAPAAAAPDMAEEGLLDYHLYTLQRPTTLAENQTKQVALLSASGVPARKELLLQSTEPMGGVWGDAVQTLKVGVFLEFDNTESARLGQPLSKGIVRVYKKDRSGNAQFVGEDRMDHTPKNNTVRLKLGHAFDVTARKQQTDFKRLGNPARPDGPYEAAFQLVLKNAKTEAVQVKVQEPLPGDWRLLSESQPSTRSGGMATWTVNVLAEGERVLNYRVAVRP